MSLQAKVATLDGVDPAHRAFYRQTDAGDFELVVDYGEDLGRLRRAIDHERQARERAEREGAELREQLTAETARMTSEAVATKLADVEKAWQTKWNARSAEMQRERDQVASLTADRDRLTLGAEARRIVDAIAIPSSASVLFPHVTNRLRVAVAADGKRSIGVVDEHGQPSTMTTDALAESFRRDPKFARVMRDGVAEAEEHARKVRETLHGPDKPGTVH